MCFAFVIMETSKIAKDVVTLINEKKKKKRNPAFFIVYSLEECYVNTCLLGEGAAIFNDR